MDVRGFCFDDGKEKCECDCANTQPHLHTPHSTLHTQYICRCEGITLDKIREYVAHGYTTLNEIKIISRAGMGACQGRTCRQLILNELAKTTGQPIDKMPVSTFRPPVQPIKMGLLLSEEEQK
ncbi:MAG: (2Fe-2S)-binding protein [Firmicutes bacterium]|nr:(2Fe-2S)-binding protein [Bacillota bacterium]